MVRAPKWLELEPEAAPDLINSKSKSKLIQLGFVPRIGAGLRGAAIAQEFERQATNLRILSHFDGQERNCMNRQLAGLLAGSSGEWRIPILYS